MHCMDYAELNYCPSLHSAGLERASGYKMAVAFNLMFHESFSIAIVIISEYKLLEN